MQQQANRRKMTEDECLAVLRELQKSDDSPFLHEVERDALIGDCFWVDFWRDFAAYVKDIFELKMPVARLKPFIHPADERTIGSLVTFLSEHATRATLEPANLLGKPCRPAGAFYALRDLLAEKGSPQADGLTPSTKLDSLSRGGLRKVWQDLVRIEPQILHALTFKWRATRLYGWRCRLFAGGSWLLVLCTSCTAVAGLGNALSGLPGAIGTLTALASGLIAYLGLIAVACIVPLGVIGLILLVSDHIIRFFQGKAAPGVSVKVLSFDGMTTVKDLCLLLAGDATFMPRGKCLKCGYNLMGNVAGRCPECFTAYAD